MNIVWLQIACLVFSFVLIIVYFSKTRLANLENKIFKNLMIFNFIGLIIELICFFTAAHDDTMLLGLVLSARLLLIYYIAFIMEYSLYVITISTDKDSNSIEQKKKIYNRSLALTRIVFLIASIVICLLPMEYYNDGISVYTYGPAIEFLKLFLMLIMGCWTIILIKNFKNLKSKKYLPVIAFIILAGIAGYVSNIYPQILLTTPMETLIIYLMFFTIENPDMRIIEELNKTKRVIEKTNSENSKFIFDITESMKKTIDDADYLVNKVLSETDEENTRENMFKMRNIITNAKARINQTLDISDEDIKNIKVVNNTYSIYEIVKQVNLILKKEIAENITFNIDINNSVPELLYGESVKVKQILVTLLSNSFKYTTEGCVELRINTIIKNDTCRLIITIEDTGCGMDLKQINDLLINDSNLTDKDLDKYNELNLNIRIVKKILQLLGGTINIDSELNKGTRVVITLDQKIYKEIDEEVKHIEDLEKQVFTKKNIAVVCDDNALSKKIIKVLDKVDVKKIECKHAKECIDKIRKDNNIDLIICQENMDKIDARELLKKVTKEEYNVPIILVTNNSDYDLKRIKIEGFASGLSEKEISLELVKKVERIINKEK